MISPPGKYREANSGIGTSNTGNRVFPVYHVLRHSDF